MSQALKELCFLFIVGLLIVSCQKTELTECCFIDDDDDPGMDDDSVMIQDTCWSYPIVTNSAQKFTDYFRKNGPGWTGADGTLSILLPDGRTLWIFGDTFLGTVNPDLSRQNFTFVNNTVLLQDGEVFTNPIQGNRSFATPDEEGQWYWPGHGQVLGDTLELIWYAMHQPNEGMWGFDYAGIDLLKYSLPDLQLISSERLVEYPKINFGTCVLKDGDYTYIYGAEKSGLSKYLHVARVPKGSLSEQWAYYDGQGWVTDPEKSRRQGPNVSEQFSVFKQEGQYYLMTQHHILGSEIYLYSSDSPYTGFNNQKILYCTPETKGDIFTYNAFVHPQFSDQQTLLISYNVNSLTFEDVLKNADNYRPKFFRVSGWNE